MPATERRRRLVAATAARYGSIYAQWTRQNHPGHEGLYRVYLSHALPTRELSVGRYRVDVEASDLCGNQATASAWFSLDNGSSL
jgi:hypothetical protein